MTRKEELAKRAAYIANWCRHSTVSLDEILEELIRGELEVWEKAAKIVEDGRFSSESAQEVQWRNATARLLRQQQEEL